MAKQGKKQGKAISFVLNDESKKNMYGYRLRNKDINLDRFQANPVLLYMHRRGEVIGKVNNLRIEGSKLLGDPEFDMGDPRAAEIAGKVERGYLKAASIWVSPGDDVKLVEAADGVLELKPVDLMEVSIVDIPANSGTIRLCSPDGEPMEGDSLRTFLSALPNDKPVVIQKQSKMSNLLKLNAASLAVLAVHGLKDGDDAEEVNAAISKLSAALEAEKTGHRLEKEAREALEKKISDERATELSAALDQAIADGKLTVDDRADYEELAKANHALAMKQLGRLQAKTILNTQLGTRGTETAGMPKDADEFQKLSAEAQLRFKNEHPAAYQQLFS